MIAIAGMIGIGKSTTTEILSKRLDLTAYYEPVEDNPILDKFYNEPKKWAFPLQIYFLNARFKMIKECEGILDRSIYEDALFTYINFMQGNINKLEYNLYLDLLDNMMKEYECLPKKHPTILIYLKGSFETVLAHIKKRGREYEQVDNDNDLLEYYKLLWETYDKWFEHYDKSDKLCVNIDDFDNAEEVCDYIVEKLKFKYEKSRS